MNEIKQNPLVFLGGRKNTNEYVKILRIKIYHELWNFFLLLMSKYAAQSSNFEFEALNAYYALHSVWVSIPEMDISLRYTLSRCNCIFILMSYPWTRRITSIPRFVIKWKTKKNIFFRFQTRLIEPILTVE